MTLLSIVEAEQVTRAVVVDGTPTLVADNALRPATIRVEWLNRCVVVDLAIGCVVSGAWRPSGGTITVTLDAATGRPDQRQDDGWSQLTSRAPSGDVNQLTIDDILTVVRQSSMHPWIQREESDP